MSSVFVVRQHCVPSPATELVECKVAIASDDLSEPETEMVCGAVSVSDGATSSSDVDDLLSEPDLHASVPAWHAVGSRLVALNWSCGEDSDDDSWLASWEPDAEDELES